MNKISLSTAIGKLELMIENLDVTPRTDLYRSRIGNEVRICPQKADVDPPLVFSSKSVHMKGITSDYNLLMKEDSIYFKHLLQLNRE